MFIVIRGGRDMGQSLHGLNFPPAPIERACKLSYWLAKVWGKRGKMNGGFRKLSAVRHQKQNQTLVTHANTKQKKMEVAIYQSRFQNTESYSDKEGHFIRSHNNPNRASEYISASQLFSHYHFHKESFRDFFSDCQPPMKF